MPRRSASPYALAVLALALGGLACGEPSRDQPTLANRPPAQPEQRGWLLVSKGNHFIESLMLVSDVPEARDIDKLAPAEFDRKIASGTLPTYHIIILDDHTPKALPPAAALLYINPAGRHAPFPIRARAAHPRVVAVDDKHPIMRWLTFSDTDFEDAAIFSLDAKRGDIALVTVDAGPLIAAGRIDGRRVVACGFSLSRTDLPMRAAFPMFLINALEWLRGNRLRQ